MARDSAIGSSRRGTLSGIDRGPSVMHQHLDALCDELAAVIDDAAASGNEVVESWTGFGQAVRQVPACDGRRRGPHHDVPAGVAPPE